MSSAAVPRGLASLYAAMLPPAPPCEPAIDVDAIAADAYRAGLAAGMAEAEAALAPIRTVMLAAGDALTAALTVDPAAVREVFVELVSALARVVVAGELRAGPEVIARLVDAALGAVEPSGDLTVRVHPDDAAALDREVVSDPTLARGTVVVDAPTFVVRDSLDARLDALLEAIA